MAFLPNTKSIASITLDLPLPLGPTTDEKRCSRERMGRKIGGIRYIRLCIANWIIQVSCGSAQSVAPLLLPLR